MSQDTVPQKSDAKAWSERWIVRLPMQRRGRPLGAIFLVLLLALSFFPANIGQESLRQAVFDAYQRLYPRQRVSGPAVIVAIDEKSLAVLGQWPWPRTLLAQLIDRIAVSHPAAIGIDALFPEPDRMSPDSLAQIIEPADRSLAARLRELPTNDERFAKAIAAAPVVLGMAGLDQVDTTSTSGRTAPFRIRGIDPEPWLRHFVAARRSIALLDDAAQGHALLSVDTRGGVVRQVPLIASVAGTLTPALSIEMLRVASGQSGYGLVVSPAAGVNALQIGDLAIPTQSDGSVWIQFGSRDASRFISAVDVLDGRVPAERFSRRLVLVGATGLGLLDYQPTPLAVRMPGIEIHAQVLENIFDNQLLRRPALVRYGEQLMFLACGLLLILIVPSLRPIYGAAMFVALLALVATTGLVMYRAEHVLFDFAWPSLGMTLVFGALLGGTLADSDRQRRALAHELELEREAAARSAGELEAARRIQLGMLPPTSAAFFRDDRFELEAALETARTVGGDLYDYFKLDKDRLFFMVGDVSGKGLPASIFMAVSKALYKSAALRGSGDIGSVMRDAQREIERDNPEAFFVTVFAAILDLASGRMQYCNGGHEPPLLAIPGESNCRRLQGNGGPPLCVLDEFDYKSEVHQLTPGEMICVVTDGVTEAMDSDGSLFGRDRLASVFSRQVATVSAAKMRELIGQEVDRYCAGAERADDITILVLRWTGRTQ